MSDKLSLFGLTIAVAVLLVVSGCAPTADLSLRFTPETSASYEVTTDVIKDFRFEQPTMDKLREEQTKTTITVGYTQAVTGIDEQGNAALDVVVDRLSVYMTSKNQEQLVFDSTDEAHQGRPLAALVGQRYTVTLAPDTTVVDFDTAAAKRAVTGGMEGNVARRLFNEDGIRERHEVPALRGMKKESIAVNESWTQVAPSPPGLLAPKSFEKVYTLTEIKTHDGRDVAVVQMQATESAEPAEGQRQAGMDGLGFFARMFDTRDDYTGSLLMDAQDGSVLEFTEELFTTYLAQEMPFNAPADAEPDTLIMRFTNRIMMKKLD